MADNTTLNAGSGGDVINTHQATQVNGSANTSKLQRILLAVLGSGDNAVDLSTTVGLPTEENAAAAATLSNVAGSATNVTLLSSNANRRGAVIFNDSSATLYVKFGATASATSYTVQIPSFNFFELPSPCYTGQIDALWDSATGNARITELT